MSAGNGNSRRDGYLDYQHQLIAARRAALWRQCERWRKEQERTERALRELDMATRQEEERSLWWISVMTNVAIAMLALSVGLGIGALAAWLVEQLR
jgi:hypothetical protein